MRQEVMSSFLAIPAVELTNLAEKTPQWHPSLLVIAILVILVTVIVFLAYRRKTPKKPQFTALP